MTATRAAGFLTVGQRIPLRVPRVPSTARVLLDFLAHPERHRYGAHRWARADLYVPDGPGPFPVVVLLHGGYWRARYSKRTMKAAAIDLARRGLAAWNVEYRRIGRGQGGGWPSTFDDVAAAIDHLAALDDPRLDIDDGVAAIGHSAGGQLALWAASASRAEPRVRVNRVVAQAAVCNLTVAGEPAWELLGGRPQEVPERYDFADPMRLVPLGVPTLLVHGAEDATVPVRRSRDYAAAARAAGDEVTLVEPVPGGHRIHPDPRSEAWRVAAEWVARPVRSAA
jgi:acetyl esterase/lipase